MNTLTPFLLIASLSVFSGQLLAQPSAPDVPTDQVQSSATLQLEELTEEDRREGRGFGRGTLETGGRTLPFRWLSPETFPNPGEPPYALVLYLHGAGRRGSDNLAQIANNGDPVFWRDSEEALYVAAPQCPEGQTWTDWLPELVVLVEELKKEWFIDPDRVYVGGTSMGGSGTWQLIALRPDLFAAAMPAAASGDPAVAAKAVGVRVWAFHGGADQLVPPAEGQAMVDALKAAGGEASLTLFDEIPHQIGSYVWGDYAFRDWLMMQRRGQPDPRK